MAELGQHFAFDYEKGFSKPKAIFRGQKYRITVLSDILVRLEYSEEGYFEDRPTQLVLNRNFNIPAMEVKEDANFLYIKTKYFVLEYKKNKPFEGTKLSPDIYLKITLLNSDKIWYLNHPEARNFKGTSYSIDNYPTKINFYNGLYSTDGFCSVDDSDNLIFDKDGLLIKDKHERTDIYAFFYRRDFGLCLKNYFELTGNPSLIPRYSLGIWWHRNIAYNYGNIQELIQKFNKHNIPLSVILLNNSWHQEKTQYTFNKSLYPSPFELINYCHERGIKLGLNINPYYGVSAFEETYSKMSEDLNFISGKAIPLNIYDKKFISSYFERIIRPLTNIGVDFFWIDYKKDLTTLNILNHYHFDDYKALSNKRGMILSRNGLVASHRYPIYYSGETEVSWDTLEFLPYYNSSAANIGLSWWSHDIGGYRDGIEDSELYMRYVQLGTYSPIFRFSADKGEYYKREPWKWDLKTLNIVSHYCNTRHKLIPYIYSEAYKYHKTGLPVIQPLYYQYPEIKDEPTYKNEYYFGSELFVAPITNPRDNIMNRVVKRIFLPNGMWYDFKTGKKFPGGKRYVTFFKDEDYPVFAKSGSIIPLCELGKNKNDTTVPDNLEIHIFPGRSNNYSLYEDDGYSSLYETGYYIVTSIDYNYQQNNYTVVIKPVDGKSGIIPNFRKYKIRFRNTKKANEVVCFIDKDQKECNAYIEDNDFIVEVNDVPTTKELRINCQGNDIEIDAVRLINEDINSIISDLLIKTHLKENIAEIIFNNDLPINKKRIAIRKLKKKGLSPLFIRMFLKLLEFIAEL